MHTTDENSEQLKETPRRRQADRDSEVIITMLEDIRSETHAVNEKLDNLEDKLTRKAVMAGALSGAISGGVTGTVMTVGIELIKAKFGG